jgi:hypothetical protein
VLASGYLSSGDRAQLADLGPAEPRAKDDLPHYLLAGGRLPVTAGRQGLEVDRARQERAQRGIIPLG